MPRKKLDLIETVCPKCGAPIKVDYSNVFIECKSCDSFYLIDDNDKLSQVIGNNHAMQMANIKVQTILANAQAKKIVMEEKRKKKEHDDKHELVLILVGITFFLIMIGICIAMMFITGEV